MPPSLCLQSRVRRLAVVGFSGFKSAPSLSSLSSLFIQPRLCSSPTVPQHDGEAPLAPPQPHVRRDVAGRVGGCRTPPLLPLSEREDRS
jgi:hypothetical protein